MPQEETPIFTVNAQGDIVILRVNGRASYLTCGPASSLFEHLLDQGKCKFAVDFENCAGMDSTFLGILAGTAMRIQRNFEDGFLELNNLGERNLELVRNLGLERILTVKSSDRAELDAKSSGSYEALPSEGVETRSVLEAHRNLVDADKANASKFEDVIKFLEKETG